MDSAVCTVSILVNIRAIEEFSKIPVVKEAISKPLENKESLEEVFRQWICQIRIVCFSIIGSFSKTIVVFDDASFAISFQRLLVNPLEKDFFYIKSILMDAAIPFFQHCPPQHVSSWADNFFTPIILFSRAKLMREWQQSSAESQQDDDEENDKDLRNSSRALVSLIQTIFLNEHHQTKIDQVLASPSLVESTFITMNFIMNWKDSNCCVRVVNLYSKILPHLLPHPIYMSFIATQAIDSCIQVFYD